MTRKRTATLSASQVHRHFDELLKRVGNGEEIVITRQGMPIARLVSESRTPIAQIREAIANIHRLRAEIGSRPGFRKLTRKELRQAIGRPLFHVPNRMV